MIEINDPTITMIILALCLAGFFYVIGKILIRSADKIK